MTHTFFVTFPHFYGMMSPNDRAAAQEAERGFIAMHELGTIYYVIDTVEKLMVENQLTKVASITLEIGEVSGIVPQYLTDFWLYARAKTEHFQETELKVETLKAVTYCQDCGKTYPTLQYAKICPYCQSGNTFLVTGNEYNIKEIEAM